MPLHQVSQYLSGANRGMHVQLVFSAAFSDRSCTDLAMAYLFNSTGWQVQPGLAFALLDAGYAAHESTFT
ncbi:hypothetical protein [Pseudomonas sp.]|uniref:hypothetical protein n=1 Tax=Pseudomonas sp. TaxID=306 RepID=UPI00261C3413|nr:hypothetical protein [Pseudomonas sp.]